MHGNDPARVKTLGPATIAAQDNARYGAPVVVTPRLGQGSFRLLVTDAYRYRCAMTSERTLPVLDAAHIRPYAKGGEHSLSNGILLRSDLHTLFDLGYLTIDPREKKIVVSDRIKAEYENGREYYKLRGYLLARGAERKPSWGQAFDCAILDVWCIDTVEDPPIFWTWSNLSNRL